MPEAVIVSTARSPDRPGLQGLAQGRPPRRPRRHGRGRRPGQGPGARPGPGRRPLPRLRRAVRRARVQHGPRRRRARRLRPPARRHAQPLLRLVGADHPDGLPRDQGRRGRRLHLAPASRRSPATSTSPAPAGPRPTGRTRASPTPSPAAPRTAAGEHARGPTRARTASCPTSTSRWARPPRTSPACAASPAQRQDEWGVTSQNRAEKAIADGFFAREITPDHDPGRHRRQHRRRPPPRRHAREGVEP